MLHTRERLERVGDRLVGHANRERCGGCGGGVLPVVRAEDPRLGRQRVVGGELHPARGARHGAEAARDDGHVARALTRERPELRRGVRVERAVPIDVVRLEVRQHHDARPQRVDVLQLERRELADDPDAVVDRADEAAQRPPDVARHLDGPRGRLEDRAEERRRRRLPVRPRHPDDRVGEEPRAELDLRDHGHVARPGGLDGRRRPPGLRGSSRRGRCRRGTRRPMRRGAPRPRARPCRPTRTRRARRRRRPAPRASRRRRAPSAPARGREREPGGRSRAKRNRPFAGQVRRAPGRCLQKRARPSVHAYTPPLSARPRGARRRRAGRRDRRRRGDPRQGARARRVMGAGASSGPWTDRPCAGRRRTLCPAHGARRRRRSWPA